MTGIRDSWRDDQEFRETCLRWAERIGVEPAAVRFAPLRRKWASCSRGGVLTFSSDLLTECRKFGEAVIVHELLHMKVPNHGAVFRALLHAHLPGAEQALTAGHASAKPNRS